MTRLSTRQRSPRRLPAEERREAILAAAKPVFGRLGYDRATTREIAAAAAVSEALLYQHFPGKRQLFEAIVNQAAADLERRLCVAADSDEPLSCAVAAFFDFVDQDRDLYRVFFRQALPAEPAFQRLYAELARHFLDLTEQGLAAAGPDSVLLAHAVSGMVSELALWWVDGRGPSRDEMVAKAVRMARAMALEVSDGR